MQRRDLLLDQVQPLQEQTQDLAMQPAQGSRGAERIRQLFRGGLQFWFRQGRQRGGIGLSIGQPLQHPAAAHPQQIAHTSGQLDPGILSTGIPVGYAGARGRASIDVWCGSGCAIGVAPDPAQN